MGRPPTGTGSAFVPRELLRPLDAFGHVSRPLEVAVGISSHSRQVLGAQLQHLVMACLREEMRRAGKSIPAIADAHQMSVDRLYRIMRGETMMHLSDFAAFGKEFPRVLAIANKYLQFLAEGSAGEASDSKQRTG